MKRNKKIVAAIGLSLVASVHLVAADAATVAADANKTQQDVFPTMLKGGAYTATNSNATGSIFFTGTAGAADISTITQGTPAGNLYLLGASNVAQGVTDASGAKMGKVTTLMNANRDTGNAFVVKGTGAKDSALIIAGDDQKLTTNSKGAGLVAIGGSNGAAAAVLGASRTVDLNIAATGGADLVTYSADKYQIGNENITVLSGDNTDKIVVGALAIGGGAGGKAGGAAYIGDLTVKAAELDLGKLGNQDNYIIGAFATDGSATGGQVLTAGADVGIKNVKFSLTNSAAVNLDSKKLTVVGADIHTNNANGNSGSAYISNNAFELGQDLTASTGEITVRPTKAMTGNATASAVNSGEAKILDSTFTTKGISLSGAGKITVDAFNAQTGTSAADGAQNPVGNTGKAVVKGVTANFDGAIDAGDTATDANIDIATATSGNVVNSNASPSTSVDTKSVTGDAVVENVNITAKKINASGSSSGYITIAKATVGDSVQVVKGDTGNAMVKGVTGIFTDGLVASGDINIARAVTGQIKGENGATGSASVENVELTVNGDVKGSNVLLGLASTHYGNDDQVDDTTANLKAKTSGNTSVKNMKLTFNGDVTSTSSPDKATDSSAGIHVDLGIALAGSQDAAEKTGDATVSDIMVQGNKRFVLPQDGFAVVGGVLTGNATGGKGVSGKAEVSNVRVNLAGLNFSDAHTSADENILTVGLAATGSAAKVGDATSKNNSLDLTIGADVANADIISVGTAMLGANEAAADSKDALPVALSENNILSIASKDDAKTLNISKIHSGYVNTDFEAASVKGAELNAKNNKVTLNNLKLAGSLEVLAGYAELDGSSIGQDKKAAGSKVTLSGNTLELVNVDSANNAPHPQSFGTGYAYFKGAGKFQDSAVEISGNKVVISGASTKLGHANNTAIISAAEIRGNSDHFKVDDSKAQTATYKNSIKVTDNVVELASDLDTDSLKNAGIYAFVPEIPNFKKDAITYSGNKIVVKKGGTLNVMRVGGANELAFEFDNKLTFKDAQKKPVTFLNITNASVNDLKGTEVTIGFNDHLNDLAVSKGDSATLVSYTVGTDLGATTKTNYFNTFNNVYTFNLDNKAASGKIDVTVADVTNNEATDKIITTPQSATTGILHNASDLAGDLGSSVASGDSVAVFAGINGGKARLHTGSHIDLNSINYAVGLGHGFGGLSKAALFFEGGYGKYKSFDQYENASGSGEIRADGKTRYFGGGVFGTAEIANGFYIDGSVRIGKVKTSYKTDDYNTMFGLDSGVDFSVSRFYQGAHIGVGKIFNLGNGDVDLYAKAFYTHTEGADVSDVVKGKSVSLGDINSFRARLGVNYTHSVSDSLKLLAGIAYEAEFAGESKGSKDNGNDAKTKSLKGSTGVANLGLSFEATDNLSIALGVKGYVGKISGVSGNLGVELKF